jgi:transcriptional regulator with XRE-family HTH domain
MTTVRSFEELYQRAENQEEYWAAHAALEFTEEVARRLEEEGISRAELARRMGTSPAYVTKILRGDVNFTLATMSKLARSLGGRLEVRLVPAAPEATGRSAVPAPAGRRSPAGRRGRSPLRSPTGGLPGGRAAPG